MSRHLGMQVSAYVDHRLDARTQHAFDQHLAVCLVCRHAADEERRLLTSLRSGPTPGFSADLQSMLLAMAQPAPAEAAAESQLSPAVPPIPRAPESVRQLRVPTVAPAAPALHRSPRRAAAIAGLAAGASAAAAIGLAVAGPGPAGSASLSVTTPRTAGTATATAIPVTYAGSGLTSSPLRQALQRPGR
ncbi:MAG TPA: zf-HC2 domain-containing protein [Lapillicoccus sp.]|nr:zf-HC2 domain-containing protein [Lapillicoccus sp.]